MPAKKHGYTGTRLYNTWQNIKKRCFNHKYPRTKNYLARGITMCSEWRDSFELFLAWAIENGYDDSLTIDRIDNNGNYEPSNCRWISNAKQQLNRRDNRMVSYNGETKPLAEWSRQVGIAHKTLEGRLNSGWSVADTFHTPILPKLKDLTGKRFGRLLVKSLYCVKKKTYWNCICDCGTIKIIAGSPMVSGATKSCGCVQREASSRNIRKVNRDKPVIQFDLQGNMLNEYKSPIEAYRKTGVSKSCISSVANQREYKQGKTRSQAGGYVWKYKEDIK